MWSTSSFPGSSTTSPVYGPVHLPAATLHAPSSVKVTGTEDSAISTSWRVSWQSPSTSAQWLQSPLSYLGSPDGRDATTTLMTIARGCPNDALEVEVGGGVWGGDTHDEAGSCSLPPQPARTAAMTTAATTMSRRSCGH